MRWQWIVTGVVVIGVYLLGFYIGNMSEPVDMENGEYARVAALDSDPRGEHADETETEGEKEI